jgi:uncharacterized membrane protein YdbT with pleckstrin-like domain
MVGNEQSVVSVRRHPALVMVPIAATLAGLLVVLILDTILPTQIPFVRDVLWTLWFAMVAWLSWKLALWWTDYFIVTNERVMLVTGLINRDVNMLPLGKVTDMRYRRPIVGRILGYGVFMMESAGQVQALSTVRFVPAPDEIYVRMCGLLFGGGQGNGGE